MKLVNSLSALPSIVSILNSSHIKTIVCKNAMQNKNKNKKAIFLSHQVLVDDHQLFKGVQTAAKPF